MMYVQSLTLEGCFPINLLSIKFLCAYCALDFKRWAYKHDLWHHSVKWQTSSMKKINFWNDAFIILTDSGDFNKRDGGDVI